MSERNPFITLLKNIEEDIEKIEKRGITLSGETDIASFQSTERKYILGRYKRHLDELASYASRVPVPARELIEQCSFEEIEENKKRISMLHKMHITVAAQKQTITISRIPEAIKDEVKADVEELMRCFDSGCYRSCVILCGRIIEVCLHATYFKATGFDILEKNPGIGLGKLIAKMEEKDIKLDPGLTQQIHLINNVRIFSVHKKQRTFHPTKEQTEAIILYTIDVVNRLF